MLVPFAQILRNFWRRSIMNPGFLAYLVGPDVFHPQAGTVFSDLRRTCQRHGVEGLEPVDGGLSKGAPCTPDTALRIYQGNVQLMHRAQGIIANLQPFRGAEMDSGSAFEVGYGLAMGKPVVGYWHDDDRSYAQRVHAVSGTRRDAEGLLVDPQGLPVEDLGLPVPVVLWHALTAFTPSSDEAARVMAGLCSLPSPVEREDIGQDGGTLHLTLERLAGAARLASVDEARPWFDRLLHDVRRAEVVTAEVDSFRGFEPSTSMAVLIGYAIGLGKTVDLVLGDQRDHGQRVRSEVGVEPRNGQLYCKAHGWLVEDMGLPVNLMLACSARSFLEPGPDSLLRSQTTEAPAPVRRLRR